MRDIGPRCARRHAPPRDDVLVVPERVVEDAIALLAEGAKLVAEGAGAVAVAALLAHPDRFAGRRVGLPVCGGNIDAASWPTSCSAACCATAACCASCWRSRTGPACWPTSPPASAPPAATSSRCATSRLFDAPSVQAAELELMIEARDPVHAALITAALQDCYTIHPA